MVKKVTMDDIAKTLNISKALVSRALSDKYGVNDDTRTKIRITALEKGYNFSKVRNLKNSRDGGNIESISVVIPRLDFIDENYYGKIVSGIEKALNQRKITFNLTIIDAEQDDEKEFLINLRKIKSDGIIIIGFISYNNIIALISSDIPAVLVDATYVNFKNDRITSNNYWGCYDACEYLVAAGHQKIGFIGNMNYSETFKERYRGFIDCIAHYDNVEAVEMTSQFGNLKEPVDFENVKKILAGSDRPTAIMCANDPTAFKLYDLLFEMGLKIPEDISVIGYDNCEKCEFVSPKLSSINVPKYEIGFSAVGMLLERIADRNLVTRDLKFDANLVNRDSIKIIKENKK